MEWLDASCKEGVHTLSQKDTVTTTGKVDDVRRVVSNDAFCIQVSALKLILECQRGNGDSGGFGRTPGKLWVTEGVKIKKSVLRVWNKHKHLKMMPHWQGLSGFTFLWWEAPQRHSGYWKRKKTKKSNALRPLEQQNGTFMMSLRFLPENDGLSRNTDWLNHRLVECAAAVRPLSCSFSGRNIQPDALERMTNEGGYGRFRPYLSVRAAAIGHD